jgi:serine/threonine protein kinase
VRTLGRGAMGVVYEGERMEHFHQRVAIKMLHSHVSLMMAEDSLRHEETVLTSLDHTAIVRLLDTGEDAGGNRYIVMEYVDGVPLDVFCREHALTRERRLELLIEIARAVEYAHRRLVVHADLKPENILVTPEGLPRLLDFGVAVRLNSGSDTTPSERYTPAFASPEQRAGARVTAATDIYSLGLIARSVLTQDTSSPLSKDLHAIMSQATRETWDQRYTSMQAFADDMQAVLDHLPVIARNGSGLYRFGKWVQHRKATASMLFLLAAVLLVSVSGVVIQTARAARQRSVAQARLYDLVRLTGTLEGELFDSAHSLPHGDEAGAFLLQAATASLDTLAAENRGDTSLELEMARQYKTLARLQRAQAGSEIAVRQDVAKSLALLRSIPANDRNYASAETEIVSLR